VKSTKHEIPYASTENINNVDLNVKKRLWHYRRMIGGHATGHSLDIGESNWIGRELGAEHNTLLGDDFNFTLHAPREKYDTIFCFEVIEHVMNPLNLLLSLKSLLAVGGRIYLSTPVMGLITWYQYSEHFTEYKLKNLHTLIRHAGLMIEKEDVFCPYPGYFALTGMGVRPVLRVLFHRNALFCLTRE